MGFWKWFILIFLAPVIATSRMHDGWEPVCSRHLVPAQSDAAHSNFSFVCRYALVVVDSATALFRTGHALVFAKIVSLFAGNLNAWPNRLHRQRRVGSSTTEPSTVSFSTLFRSYLFSVIVALASPPKILETPSSTCWWIWVCCCDYQSSAEKKEPHFFFKLDCT